MTRKKQTSQTQDIGRPPIYGVTMPRVLVRLRPDQLEWVKAQGDNVSQTVRDIIDEAMARVPGMRKPESSSVCRCPRQM